MEFCILLLYIMVLEILIKFLIMQQLISIPLMYADYWYVGILS